MPLYAKYIYVNLFSLIAVWSLDYQFKLALHFMSFLWFFEIFEFFYKILWFYDKWLPRRLPAWANVSFLLKYSELPIKSN